MVSDDVKQRVIAQYKDGVTVKNILSLNNIDYKQFWRIRNEAGIPVRKAGEMKQILSKEQEAEVIKDYQNGESFRGLAIKYEVDRSVVCRIIDHSGIRKRTINESNKKRIFPEREICHAYQSNKLPIRTIANQFDTTSVTIKRILIKNNTPLRPEHLKPGASKNNEVNKYSDRIVELYKQGLSIENIRKIIGVNTNTTSYTQIIKNAGLIPRTRGEQNKKYSINERYFENIDTPTKAYVLGLMYTDGCVRTYPRKKVVIELNIEDELTVKFIQSQLQSTAPLAYTDKNSVILSVSCPKMADDLVRHGVLHNKTKILEYPEWMPDNLFPHFARGVVDGDGYIGFVENKLSVGFCGGAPIFINRFNDRLCQFCGIKTSKQITEESNFKFQVTSWAEAFMFLNTIYKDAPMIMPRKFKKYLEMTTLERRAGCVFYEILQEAVTITSTLKQTFKDIL